MTPLQQHMIEDMSVRGLVPSTQRAYLRAVRDLTAYYKRSPDTLSTRDIQRYLCMLHEERGLTYSTCNTIVHGLRFFYGTTLGRSPANRPTSFSSGPKTGQALPSQVGCIYSATPLPPISWKRGWISTPSSA